MCDFIVLNILERRRVYNREKYQHVEDNEQVEIEIGDTPNYRRFDGHSQVSCIACKFLKILTFFQLSTWAYLRG